MFFQEADLFKGLSQETMTEISRIMVEEDYDKGAVLFTENDPANYFFVLMEGRVRLVVGTHGGIDYTLSNSGEAFGWSSLVDRDFYTARAECVAPTKVIKIEKEKLGKILDKHPESGLLIYKRLAAVVGQRLIRAYDAFLEAQSAERPASFGSGHITKGIEE
ncbi:MAG: cyclic nucleotide-binding domain-containing protein [Desulfomonile sp.]|nr:cyclic nucleotide-binding domain-containing protein [Desulfomonile sp.]